MSHSKANRSLLLVLCAALLCGALLAAVPARAAESQNLAESSACTLYVNGRERTSKPFYYGRTLMLPLRSVVEFGADWQYAYGQSTSVFGPALGTEFSVTIGKNAYRYGNRTHTLDYAPMMMDERVYVPWQYMEFALGFKVTIHEDGKIEVNTRTAQKPAVSGYAMTVNGRRINGTAYLDGDVYMVPLRPIVTALGYSYAYSNAERFSVFSAKGINTHIFWGENSYPIDNQYKKLARVPTLVDGSLYVPVSYIQQALKCSVTKSGTTLKIHS